MAQESQGRVDLDAKLEEEIEAALGDMSVEDMLDIAEPLRKTGDDTQGGRPMKTGTVLEVRDNQVFVEFGPKTQGICPMAQFSEEPETGQRLDFLVERVDQSDGLLILSREGAVQKATWEALDVGQVVECRCIGVVKGGLEVMVAQHKGFLPASQVDVHFVKDISVLLNEKVTCQIIELNRRRGRLVVSRRKVLEADRERARENLLGSLEVGKQITGVITTIQPYGAFADIGGIDGLIHVSDLSYQRVANPGEVVKEGDEVQVQILKLDMSQTPPRVSLGMKQCMADPFTTKANELTVGDNVSGKVTRLQPFGAFVELAPGVEGLVHISQISHERVNRIESALKAGEVVNCQVLSVDPETRRISLSIKALKDAPTGGNADGLERGEDPTLRKLKAQLSKKFGDNLKGGIG